jgi:hypothetical protein
MIRIHMRIISVPRTLRHVVPFRPNVLVTHRAFLWWRLLCSCSRHLSTDAISVGADQTYSFCNACSAWTRVKIFTAPRQSRFCLEGLQQNHSLCLTLQRSDNYSTAHLCKQARYSDSGKEVRSNQGNLLSVRLEIGRSEIL